MSALFEPFAIRSMTLPNRLVLPAMVTRLSGEDGIVNDDIRARYTRFARGGVGLANGQFPIQKRLYRTIRKTCDHRPPPYSSLYRFSNSASARASSLPTDVAFNSNTSDIS